MSKSPNKWLSDVVVEICVTKATCRLDSIASHVVPKTCKMAPATSGLTRGLSQGWKNLPEGDPLATVGGPLANTQKKVRLYSKSGCRGYFY